MKMSDLEQYCSENEPTDIKLDALGRWDKRIWGLSDTQIEETYIYKYTVDEVLADTYTRRDSFAVLSTDLKEVQNG